MISNAWAINCDEVAKVRRFPYSVLELKYRLGCTLIYKFTDSVRFIRIRASGPWTSLDFPFSGTDSGHSGPLTQWKSHFRKRRLYQEGERIQALRGGSPTPFMAATHLLLF